jgi:uncharacterized coiled-coil protein SlyX
MSALQESEADRQAGHAAQARVPELEQELAATQQKIAELTSGLAGANSSLKDLHAEFSIKNSETAKWIEEMITAAAEKSNANLAQMQEKLGAASRQIEALKASVGTTEIENAAPQ